VGGDPRQNAERLTPEKFEKLVSSRKASGMYYEDEDFPNDDDDPCLNLFDFIVI
jgi:hypothetical protein